MRKFILRLCSVLFCTLVGGLLTPLVLGVGVVLFRYAVSFVMWEPVYLACDQHTWSALRAVALIGGCFGAFIALQAPVGDLE